MSIDLWWCYDRPDVTVWLTGRKNQISNLLFKIFYGQLCYSKIRVSTLLRIYISVAAQTSANGKKNNNKMFVLDECYRCAILETCFLKLCVCKVSDSGDFWGLNVFYFLTWSLHGISKCSKQNGMCALYPSSRELFGNQILTAETIPLK